VRCVSTIWHVTFQWSVWLQFNDEQKLRRHEKICSNWQKKATQLYRKIVFWSNPTSISNFVAQFKYKFLQLAAKIICQRWREKKCCLFVKNWSKYTIWSALNHMLKYTWNITIVLLTIIATYLRSSYNLKNTD